MTCCHRVSLVCVYGSNKNDSPLFRVWRVRAVLDGSLR